MSSPPALTEFLGPMAVAVIFNTFLYGVCFTQFLIYFCTNSSDKMPMKLFVSWELLIDTVQTFVSIYMLWLYLVENYANPAFLSVAPWAYTCTAIFTSLSSGPIQFFLAWRVYFLSKSKLLSLMLCVFALAQAVLGIVSGAIALQTTDIAGAAIVLPLVDSWQAISLVTDLGISSSLVYFLHTNRTGFHRTDCVITQLMLGAIECAIPAAIFGIVLVVVFTIHPSSTLTMIFSLPIGRLYTNTLLHTLNSRQRLRVKMAQDITVNSIAASSANTALKNMYALEDMKVNDIHQDDSV